MIFKPKTGAMWDPSILWHDGLYYAFMMYNRDGSNGLEARHCLLATSADGVHWTDEGIVNEERDSGRGARFFKCFVGRCGDRFIMDHGVCGPEGQHIIRFHESTDLKHWDYLFSNSPDPQWYGVPPARHRWDHMYILPKDAGDPQAGYWGHPVACAKEGDPRGVGMMQSRDGRSWEILPPAKVEWGNVEPRDLEWGGCERFAGKYYLMGGTGDYQGHQGYAMFTFTANDPCGPFTPDVDAYRLCGSSKHNVAWLAVWCRGNDGLLISNYMSMDDEDRAPTMLPLRKPVADANGHLHLGWWKGNEALKAKPISLDTDSVSINAASAGHEAVLLDHRFDLARGAVIEGTILANGRGQNAAAGFVFEEDGTRAVMLLGVGAHGNRETRIGRMKDGAGFECQDVTGSGCATVSGLDDGKQHDFRLLTRDRAFELYIDDMLVQTFFYKPSSGRIGFVAETTEARFGDLRAWEMDL